MKKVFVRTLVSLLMTVVICSAEAAAPDVAAAFRAASQAKFAIKREAYRTGDAELLKSKFYDNDAVILGDGYALVGGEAIYEAYKTLLPKRHDIEVISLRSAVSEDGTLAYEITRVQATAADPSQKLPEQTILFVWRRVGKDWRVVVEMSVKGDESIPPLR